MKVARIWHGTRAEGPFLRTALWLQGCSISCPGCVNPHLWSFEGGSEVDVEELAAQIIDSEVEGITLLGGEPFDQPLENFKLASLVKSGGKGVITFSGYTYENLLSEDREHWADLLSVTDLLVDGPFIRDLPEHERAWVGSSNQRFINLTKRYINVDPSITSNRIEMRVLPNGVIETCGFATVEKLQEIGQVLSVKPKRLYRLD